MLKSVSIRIIIMKVLCLLVLMAVFTATDAYYREAERDLNMNGPRPVFKGLDSLCKKYTQKPYHNPIFVDLRQLCKKFYELRGKRQEEEEEERGSAVRELQEPLWK
ncbi:hypothetical protein LOTGIDRAFT_231756 [Lottia gigantea]|uniref:Uncharacterized protein n=1 Tax=Lottia gigantea TaxID=225164 RepID=V4ATE9_LOTGI|nr:hypothetical protein LOTGIDRAFT_231756 [Lottia gigantea]ESO97006.1 hypothetical protein LOTGIDRAFT_231756 [Lottia gigantea]